MCRAGRDQHSMAGANRRALAAKDRVQRPFLDDDGHFGVWIHTSGNPSIRRHGYLFNVERLAPLIRAQEDAGLQPRGNPFPFAQVLLVDDWHLDSFHDLPDGNVEPSNA